MSFKIKSVRNSNLETIVESKELPEFLDRMEFLLGQKGDFEKKKLILEWEKMLEDVFYSDVLMGNSILFEIKKDSVDYHPNERIFGEHCFEVGLEKIKFGGGDRFVEEYIEPKMEFRIDPENKNEINIKTFFYHSFPPFEVIEDALLLSHPDRSKEITKSDGFSSKIYFDTAIKRYKDRKNKNRLFLAPADRVWEVVKEAKEIYNTIGEYKIDELQDIKNSCGETIEDQHFGKIMNTFRKNEYRTALLKAMERGTDYVFATN